MNRAIYYFFFTIINEKCHIKIVVIYLFICFVLYHLKFRIQLSHHLTITLKQEKYSPLILICRPVSTFLHLCTFIAAPFLQRNIHRPLTPLPPFLVTSWCRLGNLDGGWFLTSRSETGSFYFSNCFVSIYCPNLPFNWIDFRNA